MEMNLYDLMVLCKIAIIDLLLQPVIVCSNDIICFGY